MPKLKVVTLSLIVKEDEVNAVESEMFQSVLAQIGLYSLGTQIRDLTPDEESEVRSQVPSNILEGE